MTNKFDKKSFYLWLITAPATFLEHVIRRNKYSETETQTSFWLVGNDLSASEMHLGLHLVAAGCCAIKTKIIQFYQLRTLSLWRERAQDAKCMWCACYGFVDGDVLPQIDVASMLRCDNNGNMTTHQSIASCLEQFLMWYQADPPITRYTDYTWRRH